MAKLDRKTLEERISERAKQQTSKRITKFRDDCRRLAIDLLESPGLTDLVGRDPQTNKSTMAFRQEVRDLFAVLASENYHTGWPSELWARDREKLEVEVLDTMNALQRVLLVKNEDTDNEPGERKNDD